MGLWVPCKAAVTCGAVGAARAVAAHGAAGASEALECPACTPGLGGCHEEDRVAGVPPCWLPGSSAKAAGSPQNVQGDTVGNCGQEGLEGGCGLGSSLQSQGGHRGCAATNVLRVSVTRGCRGGSVLGCEDLGGLLGCWGTP